MHIIIGILATIAGVLFYLSRISKSAGDLADAANEIGNLPRKLRHRKNAGKRGLDLIEDSIEAATVLMISVARMDRLGRVSDKQNKVITSELIRNMQLDREYAEDLVIQMRSITQYLNQPESTLFPMVNILRGSVDKNDAQALVAMLETIAETDDPINPDQKDFIHRFQDRMGLLS